MVATRGREGLVRRRLADVIGGAAIAPQRLAEQHGARAFVELDVIDGREIHVLRGEAMRGAVEQRQAAGKPRMTKLGEKAELVAGALT